MEKGSAARSASGFKTRRRDPGHSHSSGDIGRQVVLADERGPGEITHIECFHLRGGCVGVLQRFLTSLHGQRAQVAIRKRAERSFADADDGYLSHTFRITCRSTK